MTGVMSVLKRTRDEESQSEKALPGDRGSRDPRADFSRHFFFLHSSRRPKLSGEVIVSLFWEKYPHSKIPGEIFAHVTGIGWFSIRQAKHSPVSFDLKLNRMLLLRSDSIDVLKNFAQAKLAEIMRSS